MRPDPYNVPWIREPEMSKTVRAEPDVLGKGVYSAPEALRLINFTRHPGPDERHLSRQTVARWLRGYNYEHDGEVRHSEPLWRPDYANDDDQIEISFRDLIELRFVKAFRDIGLSLPTIRQCFERAVEEVQDARPFSTQRFRTDGKTIFLDIPQNVGEWGIDRPETSPKGSSRRCRAKSARLG